MKNLLNGYDSVDSQNKDNPKISPFENISFEISLNEGEFSEALYEARKDSEIKYSNIKI